MIVEREQTGALRDCVRNGTIDGGRERCVPRSLGKCVEEPAVAEPQDLQRAYREFLDLMPLTIDLAGLPKSEGGRYYTEEQIEARVFTIRHAYRAARSLVREIIQR